MEHHLRHLDKIHSVKLHKEKNGYRAMIDDAEYRISDFIVQENVVSFKIGDDLCTIYHAQEGERRYLAFAGEHYLVEKVRASKSGARGAAQQEENSVASQMPGLLVKLSVAVGDKVREGETLAIVEAMKMQNELCAPRAGTVEKINFSEGEQVDAFIPIVEIKPQKP